MIRSRRRSARRTRRAFTYQLARLRQRVSPAVGVKVVELLLLRRKVTVGDVVAALAEYRVGL